MKDGVTNIVLGVLYWSNTNIVLGIPRNKRGMESNDLGGHINPQPSS